MLAVFWASLALGSVLLLCKTIARYVIAASMLLTNSAKPGRIFYAIIFFPGVVIHELSHFFIATILGVQSGRLEILPTETEAGVRLGSIRVEKKDFIRNAAIGAAPLVVGLAIMLAVAKIILPIPLENSSLSQIVQSLTSYWSRETPVYYYLLFAISNTMALSKSDREHLFPLLMALAGIGFLVAFSQKASAFLETCSGFLISASASLAVSLTFVFFLNIVFFTPLFLLVKALAIIRRKKVRFISF